MSGNAATKMVLVMVASMIGLGVLASLFWGWTGYGMMGGMMGLGWLVMLVPLLFIILLVYLLVPGLPGDLRPAQGYGPTGPPQQPFQTTPASQDILSQRYARGEISRDDYLRMRDDIGAGEDCKEHC